MLTEEAFARTIPLARTLHGGRAETIEESALPWHVTRLGCRAEYWFRPDAATHRRRGRGTAIDAELDRYMHVFALNRGMLLTPFHNMALMSPATTEADVDSTQRGLPGGGERAPWLAPCSRRPSRGRPAAADIRLENVTKEFDDVVAVDGISLTIEAGQFFALLGPRAAARRRPSA